MIKLRPAFLIAATLIAAVAISYNATAHGQYAYEESPINYNKAPLNDPVSRLQEKIDAGEVSLKFSDDHGYLPSVLKHLEISFKSQIKTLGDYQAVVDLHRDVKQDVQISVVEDK